MGGRRARVEGQGGLEGGDRLLEMARLVGALEPGHALLKKRMGVGLGREAGRRLRCRPAGRPPPDRRDQSHRQYSAQQEGEGRPAAPPQLPPGRRRSGRTLRTGRDAGEGRQVLAGRLLLPGGPGGQACRRRRRARRRIRGGPGRDLRQLVGHLAGARRTVAGDFSSRRSISAESRSGVSGRHSIAGRCGCPVIRCRVSKSPVPRQGGVPVVIS